MATPRTRLSAGIHLDGNTATVVLVRDPHTSPVVDAVKHLQAFTHVDALQSALDLYDEDIPTRVTFSMPGVATVPLDLTPATLDRAGFETTARRTFGNIHHTAAIAGIVTDEAAIRAGQLQTGLAVAAPAEVVADLQRALLLHPVAEVTTSAAAYGPLDGLHLALRRATSELTLVVDGRPVVSQILATGGFDEVAASLGGDVMRINGSLAGEGADPLAAAVLRAWLQRVAENTAAVLDEWAINGHATDRQLFVHGRAAAGAYLDDILAENQLRRNAHPLAGLLPHSAPLDAVDAYYAALTCGTRLPLGVFADPHRDQTPTKTTRKPRRTKNSKTAKSSKPASRTKTRNPKKPAAPRTARTRQPAGSRVATAGLAVLLAAPVAVTGYGYHSAAAQLQATRHQLAATPDTAARLDAAQLQRVRDTLTGQNTAAAAVSSALAGTDDEAETTAHPGGVDVVVHGTPDTDTALLATLEHDTSVTVTGHSDPASVPFTLTVDAR